LEAWRPAEEVSIDPLISQIDYICQMAATPGMRASEATSTADLDYNLSRLH